MCQNGQIKHPETLPMNGKFAVAWADEFELMFTNTEVHKIVRISKIDQDNPNL